MSLPVGRIERLTSFWRRPKFEVRCDEHGDLGRFDTQRAALDFWEVHTSTASHGWQHKPTDGES